MKKAILALADGLIFEGESFGASGEGIGEVVFNTSITGYQEILTDSSYKGQIVTMTYPLIGNYGVNREDIESAKPQVQGFIIKEYCPYPSNYRCTMTLDYYMKEYDIVGIQDIDTRALTRHIRDCGAQQGIISTIDFDSDSLISKIKSSPGLIGRDLVKEVTCNIPNQWCHTGVGRLFVIAYDCGIKWNILRSFADEGMKTTVVPANFPAEEILNMNPDGIFLSNGPGDPEGVPYIIESVRKLIGKKPIFGICLGHQIIALALGGKTYKLKFGHHGGNQPVMDLLTGRVEITAQNHGFAVDMNSFKNDELILTHINLNDNTCEGMMHKELPVFSVQYHPEASPGPHDSLYLFARFKDMMQKNK